jgi:flavin-dependent dehydrogenase
VTGVRLEGAPAPLRARLFVDASGMRGAVRRRSPWLAERCPPAGPLDTCAAAQYVVEVVDRAGAAAFARSHGASPGDSVALAGVAGGYSVLTVLLARDLSHAGVLTGTIPASGQPGGAAVLSRFVESQPWLGRRLYGGEAPIPLRRPYLWLVGPGVALLGDAACQVYGAHGSGVGLGLVAARMLADAARGADPGDLHALHRGYNAPFQRLYGGLLAGADVFRRLSQTLTADDIGAMIASGLLTPAMTLSGIDHRAPDLTFEAGRDALRGAARAPRLAARLAPVLARIGAAQRLWRAFPESPSETAVERFGRLADRVTGVRG